MTVLIKIPNNLTAPERDAFEWAVSGLQNALRDSLFLQDNPGIDTDADEQFDDMLYRLEEQAKEMEFHSAEKDGFAAACKRTAVKLRQANPEFP